jgi:hypothetical protein
MTQKSQFEFEPNKPAFYRIKVQGQVDSQWTDWFEDMTISYEEDGNTLISGQVADQAALHGLLKKIRDLGMTLIYVCPGLPPNQDEIGKKKE